MRAYKHLQSMISTSLTRLTRHLYNLDTLHSPSYYMKRRTRRRKRRKGAMDPFIASIKYDYPFIKLSNWKGKEMFELVFFLTVQWHPPSFERKKCNVDVAKAKTKAAGLGIAHNFSLGYQVPRLTAAGHEVCQGQKY